MSRINDRYRHDIPKLQICQKLVGSSLALSVAFSVPACRDKGPRTSSQELGGSNADRVAEISKIIRRTAPLPGPILDARFAEDQTGDRQLGPSDFATYYCLRVAPADLAKWRSTLPPLSKSQPTPSYAIPRKAPDWWVTQEDFKKLDFYSPKSLTGRGSEWVGVAPDGKIFVHAFTM
jgi:hypothetical protein